MLGSLTIIYSTHPHSKKISSFVKIPNVTTQDNYLYISSTTKYLCFCKLWLYWFSLSNLLGWPIKQKVICRTYILPSSFAQNTQDIRSGRSCADYPGNRSSRISSHSGLHVMVRKISGLPNL